MQEQTQRLLPDAGAVSSAGVGTDRYPRLRQASRFWRRFRRNKGAVFGLGVFVLIVLSSVFAAQLAPYDPIYQDFMLCFS